MNKKIPNWTDLYTFEDYLKAQQAFSTFDCGLSPVCLSAPSQHFRISLSQKFGDYKTDSATICVRTLKLEYAIQVWTKAALISSTNRNPLMYYWWIDYQDSPYSFRELKYSNTYGIDQRSGTLIQGFWNLLEEIANSETIKVREGYTVSNGARHASAHISYSVVLDLPEADWHKADLDNIYEYPYDLTPKSYKWEEIKDMFVELSLHQLSLYDSDKFHKSTSEDELLFCACNAFNINLVKQAVQLGANVNALDKGGESALQKTIEYCRWRNLYIDKEYSPEEEAAIIANNYRKCREIVEYLVSQGADVDLYGIDGMQPLMCAYYDGNLDMVKFLFEHGSNPNYNSFRCDDINRSNTHRSTLIKVLDDEPDEYTDFQLEVYKLAREHGAHYYDFDYNPRTGEHLGKSFVSFGASEKDTIFWNNGGCAIGTPHQITFEECNDHLMTVTLPEIPGIHSWLQDYREHIKNPDEYDWKEWNQRGLNLAQEIANVLPDSVALHYYYGHHGTIHKSPYGYYYIRPEKADLYIPKL